MLSPLDWKPLVLARLRRAITAVWFALAVALGTTAPALRAQEAPTADATVADSALGSESLLTMFPHPESGRFWVSGQMNFITQYHPAFRSPYSGPNSLSADAQDATSRVLTLYTGVRLTDSTELLCDFQEAGGNGLGAALGVAGFMNLDVVRNPSLSKAPYVARFMYHHVFGLSTSRVVSDRNPFSLFTQLPQRRLELRVGKFSIADFFDMNTYGTDSNFQFANWTVDNNGAYDYAADTRGFTYAAMLEYHDRGWILRFSEALMPKVANGEHLDADLARARAENVELELHASILKHHPGTLRLLSFVNHANMGVYRVAVDNYLDGLTPTPDITAHPPQTTVKYGFGANFEQPLTDWMGVFGRWGWNEGQHESYAYTEVDGTVLLGVGGNGAKWHRKNDRAGFAFVSNAISGDHRSYLAHGGLGFLLGDGRLNYGRENIEETYYTFHLWRGIYPSMGLQHVNNPGYNRDRGPVLVPTGRLHLEF